MSLSRKILLLLKEKVERDVRETNQYMITFQPSHKATLID